ncbi:T9SS type A sorting domain-containing protein [Epilithonimonas arachidiradicis]|uniref:Putative secreted protein (Por secretion system target) n=1 Tax=Epilithonimonas arachidiradicis TaxID=1617282 RepID=A0A420DAT8_9FLAO|nr:T9SS type A sorting domain-containing protein [Epilithonimonas arachidiradicis]RKE88099.1 putative secreted protein (Por secretion system target) [Epilithonimonas arachidiradicis]GGG51358.1 hypothetical protein GCM10007332_11310 [Epilithonimonas arachidiradicis]
MKKILLSFFATSAIFYSVNAQTKISFEASEGFTLGDILGQNANINTFWSDSASVEDTAEITSEKASDGTNSVKIINYDDTELGGIYITNIPSYGKTTISYDIFVPELGGSDNMFMVFTEEGGLINVDFDYEGNVLIGNYETQEYEEITTYNSNTWYNLKAEIDFSTREIKYYLNNNLIHTGTAIGTATTIEEIDFAIDNFGTDAYFDNIQVKDTTLAVSEAGKKDIFTIYPNPAVDVVNFDVAGKINSVEVYDAAGKLVKSVNDGAKSVNVAALAKGSYVVKVKVDNKTYTKKVIKK